MTFLNLRTSTLVEVAFGVDPGADPAGWTWTTLLGPDSSHQLAQSLQWQHGYSGEQSAPTPAEVTIVLDNPDGSLTPDDPRSPHYPDIVIGMPLRVLVDGAQRFAGQVVAWDPSWPYGDLSGENVGTKPGESYVTVVAAGILRRLGQGQPALPSAPELWIPTTSPVAYWSLAEGSLAELGAATVGAAPIVFSGTAPEPGQEMAPWLGTGIRTTTPAAPLSTLRGQVVMEPISAELRTWAVDWMVLREQGLWRVEVFGDRAATGHASRTDWVMFLLGGGDLELWRRTVDDDSSSMTFVDFASTPRLEDDRPHHVRLSIGPQPTDLAPNYAVYVDGVMVLSGAAGLSQPAMQPASQVLLQSAVDGAHIWRDVAVWQWGDIGIPEPAVAALAAQGFAGETDVARVLRVLGEAAIPAEVPPQPVADDDFDRAETGTWGTSSSGHDWLDEEVGTASAVDLDVAGGVGTVTIGGAAGPGGTRLQLGTPELADVDVTALVRVDGTANRVAEIQLRQSVDDVTFPGSPVPVGYAAGIFAPPTGPAFLQITRRTAALPLDLAAVEIDVPAATWVWLRAQAVGSLLRLRMWLDGEPEPAGWQLVVHDAIFRTGRCGMRIMTLSPEAAAVEVAAFAVGEFVGVAMGPQYPATMLDLLQEASDTGLGMLSEPPDHPGLYYRPLASMVNRDPSMVLDASAGGVGDIVVPFAPTLDDQAVRNDVTVSRVEGSSARAVDTADVARRGRRTDDVAVNVASDQQLPDQATWRLHVGVWPGMRYPAVSPALNGRPQLIPAWLDLRVGDRVTVVNLPPQHPLDDVDLLVQGYVETVRPHRWDAELICVPYGPHVVAEVGPDSGPTPPDAPSRYSPGTDADPGIRVQTAFQAGTDTELEIVTTAGPTWTTDPDDFPVDLRLGGSRIRAVGAAPSIVDTFARTETGGWGSADTGEAWAIDAISGSSNVDVAGGVGTINVSSAGITHVVIDSNLADTELLVSVESNVASGATGLLARRTTAANNYALLIDGSGDLLLAVVESPGPGFTLLDSVNLPWAAGAAWWLRFRLRGSMLLAKAWPVGGPEPGWLVGATDDTHASGAVACIRSGDGIGTFDDFQVVNPQRMTVQQEPINGVAKTIPAGSPVELWTPARYAL